MGVATTRIEDRIAASLGKSSYAQVKFEHNEGLCGAGVLFLLPSLLEQGLLKTSEVYNVPSGHYYSLESIVLTLAFMALSRIKNPEQLKQCKPGEIGRIIGLDRIPEVRNLREKIGYLSDQQQAGNLNNILLNHWYREENEDFYYVDGHVRVYYGSKANLPAKFVSRQKLCLNATTEFWVNDAEGLPIMMVMGELNEKLQNIIESSIIPKLEATVLKAPENGQNKEPRCTLIFDREAYEPAFFQRLWDKYRIAVITYRKNVKDNWEESDFIPIDTKVMSVNVRMHISESKTELGGYVFREIRRLSDDGHQTAIITTHPTLATSYIAERMFGRWSQENFFRYLIQDYDFDKMIQFGTESIDMERDVVNPAYRKLTAKIKSIKDKITRTQAKMYKLTEVIFEQEIDKVPKISPKQMECMEMLARYRKKEASLQNERSSHPARIKLKEMPEQKRYNKLKTESKVLMNVIKMICYRAETSIAGILSPFFYKAPEEKRMLVKQIIKNHADLIPDDKQKTLTVVLHGMSTPRHNKAVEELARLLTETDTVFPGSNMKMIFKTTTVSNCEG